MTRPGRTEVLGVGDSSSTSHARLGRWVSCWVEGYTRHLTFKISMITNCMRRIPYETLVLHICVEVYSKCLQVFQLLVQAILKQVEVNNCLIAYAISKRSTYFLAWRWAKKMYSSLVSFSQSESHFTKWNLSCSIKAAFNQQRCVKSQHFHSSATAMTQRAPQKSPFHGKRSWYVVLSSPPGKTPFRHHCYVKNVFLLWPLDHNHWISGLVVSLPISCFQMTVNVKIIVITSCASTESRQWQKLWSRAELEKILYQQQTVQ